MAVATLPPGASVEDAKVAVLDSLDPADIDTCELVADAFATLEQSGATSARNAMRSIRVSDPKQVIGPGVHLLNGHTGKGQQFDWVFVVGLEEDHLPLKRNNQGAALDEELRVLLVMLSRARHGVLVTRAEMQEGRYGPYKARVSRWWSGIRAEYSQPEEIEAHLLASEP